MSFGLTPHEPREWSSPKFISIAESLVDAHWAQDIVEFDGPRVGDVLGYRYVTLTHNGPKVEGEAIPGELVWTEAEAWHRYNLTLARHVAGAKQVVWRERPYARQDPRRGNWYVSSRLYWDTMKEPE